MRYLPLLLFCISILPCAATEIYTWTDADGRTHYSDKPPADAAVSTIDLEAQALTVIGDAGLRPGEQELLRRYEEEAARDQALRRQQAASRPAITVVQPAEDDDDDDSVYFFPHHGHLPHHFKHRPRNDVHISVHGGFKANKHAFQFHAEHGARPPRQLKPHHNVKPQRYAKPAPKTMKGVRGGISSRPGLGFGSP